MEDKTNRSKTLSTILACAQGLTAVMVSNCVLSIALGNAFGIAASGAATVAGIALSKKIAKIKARNESFPKPD